MNDGLIKPGAVQVAGRLEGEMAPCIYYERSEVSIHIALFLHLARPDPTVTLINRSYLRNYVVYRDKLNTI